MSSSDVTGKRTPDQMSPDRRIECDVRMMLQLYIFLLVYWAAQMKRLVMPAVQFGNQFTVNSETNRGLGVRELRCAGLRTSAGQAVLDEKTGDGFQLCGVITRSNRAGLSSWLIEQACVEIDTVMEG